jgi:plasmid maintenance system killer protein
MEISFATQKLQKLCNNDKKLRGEFGPTCAQKVQRRLTELDAAECLEDLRNCHRPVATN